MPWNPIKYNQFKDIRYQPFLDLMDMISEKHLRKGIDLGCGTGEQTSILANRFENASFLGIDASSDMLATAHLLEHERLRFQQMRIEQVAASGKVWDLLFSNAALQWSNNHQELFPQLLRLLTKNGQFAVQIPMQHENILNMLLLELVGQEPFCSYLEGWKRDSPVLSIDAYVQIMFDGGLDNIQVNQKVYPIIANNEQVLFDFIAGSALIPYMERLEGKAKELFIQSFKDRIAKEFKRFPVMYAFKRLLLYGKMR